MCAIRVFQHKMFLMNKKINRKWLRKAWNILGLPVIFLTGHSSDLSGTQFLSLLNFLIYMQVSEKVDVCQLSFWFLFRKQHVRVDGGDGEQSYALIKSSLFWNTVLVLEILLMHIFLEFWIKKLHYSSLKVLAQNLNGKT